MVFVVGVFTFEQDTGSLSAHNNISLENIVVKVAREIGNSVPKFH